MSEGKVLELLVLVADLKPNMWRSGFERAVLRPSLFVRVMNNTEQRLAPPRTRTDTSDGLAWPGQAWPGWARLGHLMVPDCRDGKVGHCSPQAAGGQSLGRQGPGRIPRSQDQSPACPGCPTGSAVRVGGLI